VQITATAYIEEQKAEKENKETTRKSKTPNQTIGNNYAFLLIKFPKTKQINIKKIYLQYNLPFCQFVGLQILLQVPDELTCAPPTS